MRLRDPVEMPAGLLTGLRWLAVLPGALAGAAIGVLLAVVVGRVAHVYTWNLADGSFGNRIAHLVNWLGVGAGLTLATLLCVAAAVRLAPARKATVAWTAYIAWSLVSLIGVAIPTAWIGILCAVPSGYLFTRRQAARHGAGGATPKARPEAAPAADAGTSGAAQAFCRRAIAYLKATEGPAGEGLVLPDDDQPVLEEFCPGVAIAYVVDEGDVLAFVQNRHLAAAGLDRQALHGIGLGNLAALADEKLEVRQFGPVQGLFLGGNLEAGLVLVDRLWDEVLNHTVSNGYVAAMTARDVLAYCDAGSEEGIARLRQMVAGSAGLEHGLLGDCLLQRRDGRWSLLPLALH